MYDALSKEFTDIAIPLSSNLARSAPVRILFPFLFLFSLSQCFTALAFDDLTNHEFASLGRRERHAGTRRCSPCFPSCNKLIYLVFTFFEVEENPNERSAYVDTEGKRKHKKQRRRENNKYLRRRYYITNRYCIRDSRIRSYVDGNKYSRCPRHRFLDSH